MTTPGDLARHVAAVAGGLGLALAAGCGLLLGPREAAGALLGGALTMLNFGGLAWIAGRAARGVRPAGGRRPVLWVGASGFRLGLVAAAVGLAVVHGGVGPIGLLLSLALVPMAVIVSGLVAARVS